MTRVTLKDVAREAGLSVTQVSRALNGHDDVAESTKQHAREVAKRLEYQPNLEARRLQDPAARTGVIGIILPGETLRFSDPFFGDLLSSMVVTAGAHGLQLQLSTPPADSNLVAPYADAMQQGRVDGFVLVRTLVDDPRVALLLEANMPFVAFGRPFMEGEFASVDSTPDVFGSAIDHLHELGHTQIACLAEPPQFALAARRVASLQAAIAGSGRSMPEPTVIVAGFHEADGLTAARALLSGPDRPTAIVALNDLLALGTMQAAEQLSISIPEELSVLGFDDIAAARLVTPGLTTIRQSAKEAGSMLIEELLPLIEARGSAHRERHITPELIIRQSTGVLA